MNRTLKDFALLVAGASAGVFGSLIMEKPIKLLLTIVVGLFFLVSAAYGLSIIDVICRALIKYSRSRRINKHILIGVLNDIEWKDNYENICTWTNISTEEWINKIKNINKQIEKKVNIEKVKLTTSIIKYNYIINPYGGVYPESDTVKKIGLEIIMDYVSGGGIFVNIADIPGYWMYNPELKIKIDATPTIYGTLQQNNELKLIPVKPFQKTPFMEILSLNIINVSNSNMKLTICNFYEKIFIKEEIEKYQLDRLVIIEKNIQPIISFIDKKDNKEYSPLFFVPYGKGKYLFSLFLLKSNENIDITNKIIKIINEENNALKN